MINRHLHPKRALCSVLFILLLSMAGMTKMYAYNVTIGTISNGTIVANPTTANEGDTVTLTATPGTDYLSNYLLESWAVVDTNNVNITVTQDVNPNIGTFIMPASDVMVTASFVRTHLLYMLFEDYQACEQLVPQREWNGIDDIKCIQLPRNEAGMQASWYYQNGAERNTGFIALAQNEKEGFQVFYREQEKERSLSIEVGPFVNSQNEVLQHSIYWEEFFWAENVGVPDSLAEALVPYSGGTLQTTVGHNKVFYVELTSTKNQTPGIYTSTITAFDGDVVLTTRTITAKVWNFALPDNHYSEVVMGLYNRNSGYGATSSFLSLNGINVDAQGNVAESDLPAAKQILDGYQECLLEHGVSTNEIPRWKMADDLKAAELTMADPRRKVFSVPVNRNDFNGTAFSAFAQNVITQYKDLVYDNPFLKDKAFFYPMDEPAVNEGNATLLNAMSNSLADLWPGYHAVVPFNGDYNQTVSMLEGKADIFCPNQGEFDPYNGNYNLKQANFEDFIDRDNHPDRFRTWRYQGDGKCGGTYYWIYALSTVGVMRRIPFWQQFLMNSDGWLQWNCAYLPTNWVKKRLSASTGIQTGNGDGVLLYPGTMFGQNAETPIVSLRLKQLSAGIDDYDYLRLGKEFLSEENITTVLNRVYWYNYVNNCKFLNKELGHYAGYTCTYMQRARYDLGQFLDAANTEHTWGEWQTAVLPDETHAGLEIRTCSHCGAQESREKTFLYRFVGTEDNQWANLNNWEGNPETLPASGEAVVIAHDCEINTNTTVFNVIVNDGINLTINEGATLTSVRMSTSENAQVIIEDGAQLYTHSEGVQATVKKNIAPHGDSDGWYFISTSLATEVEPSTSNGIAPSTDDGYDLYYFDQSENLEWRNYKADSFNLENGQGYLFASQSETTLNFSGQLNASNAYISVPISYGNGTLAGLNLVGNPFACNAYLLDENNEIMPFFKINETGDTIFAAQAGTAVKPCEGVFVICPNDRETHSVIFTTTAPENLGEAQDVPPVSLPLHDLLVNQDAFPDNITQTTTLSEGWNWVSTSVEVTLENLQAALLNAFPEAGVNALIIKSNGNGQTAWNPTAQRWIGGLNMMDLSQMYMIKVATAGEITLEGMPINTADHPIIITSGNNWIAFPLSESMDVTNAFAGFPANGDVVKSNSGGQATWNSTANRWIGGLTTLEPGKGYIYNSKATENKTFVFPISVK